MSTYKTAEALRTALEDADRAVRQGVEEGNLEFVMTGLHADLVSRPIKIQNGFAQKTTEKDFPNTEDRTIRGRIRSPTICLLGLQAVRRRTGGKQAG